MIIKNDEDYIKFVKKDNNLTNCQKSMLIIMKKNSYTFYKPVSSNIQLITYLNYSTSNNNFTQEAKLKNMLKNFTSAKNVLNIIHKLKNKIIIKDTDVIDTIIKYKGPREKKDKNDISTICNPWKYIIEMLGKKTLEIFDRFEIKYPIKYLDVGCGRGHKTLAYGKEIGLEKNEIYGTDILDWGPYEQQQITHKFNFKIISSNGKLDYDEDTFDLITCFLMLHHVEKLSDLLNEIKRILKPNGILLIIEHDVHNDYDRILIDILHTFYGIIIDKKENYIENSLYSQYYNWSEWNYIFYLKNFIYIDRNYLFTQTTQDLRFDNIYYTFYKNKK
jgi:ubiquinone/menaquinone biosynthesis C-methylase UbiE